MKVAVAVSYCHKSNNIVASGLCPIDAFFGLGLSRDKNMEKDSMFLLKISMHKSRST